VVYDPKGADAILELSGENREKIILSLTGTGRVREFRLRYRISYRVHDRQGLRYVPTSVVELSREVTYNDAEILAKEAEEQLLFRRQWRATWCSRLLRRLAFGRKPQTGRRTGEMTVQLPRGRARGPAQEIAAAGLCDPRRRSRSSPWSRRRRARRGRGAPASPSAKCSSRDAASTGASSRTPPAACRCLRARKIVELRLGAASPDPRRGGDRRVLRAAERDQLLLVTLPRLDRTGQGSAWFKRARAPGRVVDVWPVERLRLPAWIGERARTPEAARAARGGGIPERSASRATCFAAHQSCRSSRCSAPEGELALDMVQEAVASVARYDPYDAAEALVSGELARYVRVIEGLHAEGEATTFILFVISGALFALQEGSASASSPFAQRAVESASPLFQEAARRGDRRGRRHRSRHQGVGTGRCVARRFIRLGLKLADGSKG